MADRRCAQRAAHRARRDPHGAGLLRVVAASIRCRCSTRRSQSALDDRVRPERSALAATSEAGQLRLVDRRRPRRQSLRDAGDDARGAARWRVSCCCKHYRTRLQNIFEQLASSTQQVPVSPRSRRGCGTIWRSCAPPGRTALAERFPNENIAAAAGLHHDAAGRRAPASGCRRRCAAAGACAVHQRGRSARRPGAAARSLAENKGVRLAGC